MPDRDVEADDAAVAPADQGCLVDAEMVEQGQIVVGHQLVAERLRGARAAAVAAAVGDDHLVVLGECRDLKAPDVGMAEAAVDQQHRLALAIDGVVHLDVVHRRHAALGRLRHGGGSGSVCQTSWALPAPTSRLAAHKLAAPSSNVLIDFPPLDVVGGKRSSQRCGRGIRCEPGRACRRPSPEPGRSRARIEGRHHVWRGRSIQIVTKARPRTSKLALARRPTAPRTPLRRGGGRIIPGHGR